jgi:hypothetical protein
VRAAARVHNQDTRTCAVCSVRAGAVAVACCRPTLGRGGGRAHATLTCSCAAPRDAERSAPRSPPRALSSPGQRRFCKIGLGKVKQVDGRAPPSLKSRAMFFLGRDSGISSTCRPRPAPHQTHNAAPQRRADEAHKALDSNRPGRRSRAPRSTAHGARPRRCAPCEACAPRVRQTGCRGKRSCAFRGHDSRVTPCCAAASFRPALAAVQKRKACHVGTAALAHERWRRSKEGALCIS